MKKLISVIVVAVVAVLILAVLVAFFFLNSLVKKGVETVGPRIVKVEMKLDGASVSLFSGEGGLKGLFVGNPEGYKTPSAIRVGQVSVAIKPGSLLSDKIVVRRVTVESPEITFEGSLSGNNLSKILANVQAFTASEGGSGKKGEPGGKKIQVDDFQITGGQISLSMTVLGERTVRVPLPDIHLQNLGQGGDGITPGDLVERVFRAVLEGTTKAVSGALGNLGKEATGAVKDLGQGTGNQVEKVTKGLGDLFKKKQ